MLQMILLEGAKATTETVDALRTGAAAMKAMQKATYVVLSGLLNSFVILYFPEYKYKLACFWKFVFTFLDSFLNPGNAWNSWSDMQFGF